MDFNSLIGESAKRRQEAIEKVCEMSLMDPEMRGVLVVDNIPHLRTDVSLDASVPWGNVHYKTEQ